MTTYHDLDEAQHCPACAAPMVYLGVRIYPDDIGQQWWLCGNCGMWWSDEALAYAAAHRIMHERLAARAAGQMTLPGMER